MASRAGLQPIGPIASNLADMESLLEKWNREARLQTPVDWYYSLGPRSFIFLDISAILTLLKNFCISHWMGPRKSASNRAPHLVRPTLMASAKCLAYLAILWLEKERTKQTAVARPKI